jgi:NAD(P)-dependent dehydrogenase (short-subunit alcohol dehydrogenase family)
MAHLDGKAAVVTGAGRGIGKEIALLLARQGARVVVNDLGGSDRGEGADKGVAQQVVDEIKAAGGEAVTNPDSVASWEGAQRIIRSALEAFGRIDIVVNNAGIVRDRMIFKMSEEEWDAVVGVHLKGTFNCIRAAAPHMREQKWGRFVNFTSTSGLIGNIGQANYGAAKMGVVALSKIAALDMKKYGVTSNCIAPFAWTRLIATIPTDSEDQKKRVEKLKRMSPADVAPLAVFLAGEQASNITGQVFGVRGKEIFLFSQPRIVRSMHKSDGWEVQDLNEMLEATMKSHFTPLDTSPEYIGWDPLV